MAGYSGKEGLKKSDFRKIPGFSKYEINPSGTIISYMKDKPKAIKPWFGQNGYLYVTIRTDEGVKKNLTLHRLIAKVFIPNPEGLPHVRHYNDNHLDNRLENLVWGTHLDNHDDMMRNGHEYHKEVYCYELDKIYRSGAEFAREFGCSKSAVTLACQGKNGSVCGYHVCFLEDKDQRIADLERWLKPYKYINKVRAKNVNTGEEMEFDNFTEAANHLGCSISAISMVIHGRIESTKGWVFWQVG